MQYGFSYMGFLFALLVVGPSFYWINLKGYEGYWARKSGIFQGMERIGLTASLCVMLIFRNYNYQGVNGWLLFLVLAWIFLLLYELHWILCRKRGQLPVVLGRVPMTVLSGLALLFLGIYGRSLYLVLSALLYGVGHSFGDREEPEEDWHCSCCCGDSCQR